MWFHRASHLATMYHGPNPRRPVKKDSQPCWMGNQRVFKACHGVPDSTHILLPARWVRVVMEVVRRLTHIRNHPWPMPTALTFQAGPF